jgi:hypothetical protein
VLFRLCNDSAWITEFRPLAALSETLRYLWGNVHKISESISSWRDWAKPLKPHKGIQFPVWVSKPVHSEYESVYYCYVNILCHILGSWTRLKWVVTISLAVSGTLWTDGRGSPQSHFWPGREGGISVALIVHSIVSLQRLSSNGFPLNLVHAHRLAVLLKQRLETN